MTDLSDPALLVHGICRDNAAAGVFGAQAQQARPGTVLIESGGLIALCSRLDKDTSEIEACFKDPDQVLKLALEHDEILKEVSSAADVLPLRFGSLMSGRSAVKTMLAERGASFAEALGRLENALELGLAIYKETGAGTPAVDRPGQAPATSGRDFLKTASARRSAKRDMEAQRYDFLKRLADGLSAECRGLRSIAARKASADGSRERIANWALLVRRDHQETITAKIGQLSEAAARLNLALTLSGPWPPYSFAAGSTEADNDATG